MPVLCLRALLVRIWGQYLHWFYLLCSHCSLRHIPSSLLAAVFLTLVVSSRLSHNIGNLVPKILSSDLSLAKGVTKWTITFKKTFRYIKLNSIQGKNKNWIEFIKFENWNLKAIKRKMSNIFANWHVKLADSNLQICCKIHIQKQYLKTFDNFRTIF